MGRRKILLGTLAGLLFLVGLFAIRMARVKLGMALGDREAAYWLGMENLCPDSRYITPDRDRAKALLLQAAGTPGAGVPLHYHAVVALVRSDPPMLSGQQLLDYREAFGRMGGREECMEYTYGWRTGKFTSYGGRMIDLMVGDIAEWNLVQAIRAEAYYRDHRENPLLEFLHSHNYRRDEYNTNRNHYAIPPGFAYRFQRWIYGPNTCRPGFLDLHLPPLDLTPYPGRTSLWELVGKDGRRIATGETVTWP